MNGSYPSLVSVVAHVHFAAVIGKIGQDDAQVHEASEHTGTQTTYRRW